MRERAAISYFFQLHPTHVFVREEENNFTHEAVLNKALVEPRVSIWRVIPSQARLPILKAADTCVKKSYM